MPDSRPPHRRRQSRRLRRETQPQHPRRRAESVAAAVATPTSRRLRNQRRRRHLQALRRLALVQTVDFFTPIVDDPFLFGQVAATNALSDVFAMGGRPISALTIVAFPTMRAAPKCSSRSCAAARQNDRSELHRRRRPFDPRRRIQIRLRRHGPDRSRRKFGAMSARGPATTCSFTKPLGTGVISTALKQAKAAARWSLREAFHRLDDDASIAHAADVFTKSNRLAGAPKPGTIHAVTDVTGFGLLGHAREMAIGSGVSFDLHHDRFAYLPGRDRRRARRLSLRRNGQQSPLRRRLCQFAPPFPTNSALSSSILKPPAACSSPSLPLTPIKRSAGLKRNNVDAHAIGSVQPKGAHLLSIS